MRAIKARQRRETEEARLRALVLAGRRERRDMMVGGQVVDWAAGRGKSRCRNLRPENLRGIQSYGGVLH